MCVWGEVQCCRSVALRFLSRPLRFRRARLSFAERRVGWRGTDSVFLGVGSRISLYDVADLERIHVVSRRPGPASVRRQRSEGVSAERYDAVAVRN